jgi:hypothetical protein
MKEKITLAKLVIKWSDGKTEDLASVLPEYLREELEVYFDELEDLRLEHDAGLRDEPYTFEQLFNEQTKGESK